MVLDTQLCHCEQHLPNSSLPERLRFGAPALLLHTAVLLLLLQRRALEAQAENHAEQRRTAPLLLRAAMGSGERNRVLL